MKITQMTPTHKTDNIVDYFMVRESTMTTLKAKLVLP